MAIKRKRGRPKKTPEKDFPKGWANTALSLYKKGASDVEIRAMLGGISEDLFYRLLIEDKNFSQTIKKGRIFCEAWWHFIGRTGLEMGKINVGMFAIQMRNRFGWSDANKERDDIRPETVDFDFEVLSGR